MPGFVVAHARNDLARAQIARRQLAQVGLQMLDHLALGLGDEAEAQAIARQPLAARLYSRMAAAAAAPPYDR